MKAVIAVCVCASLAAHADTKDQLKSLGDNLNTAWIQRDGTWWLSDQGEEGMKPQPCQKLVGLTSTALADDTGANLRSLGVKLHRAWVKHGTVWWVADYEENGMAPPPCQKVVDELVAARVPDSETFMMPGDARDLSSGKHTFGEAKANCNQVAYVSKVKVFATQLYKTVEVADAASAKKCLDLYSTVIKAGVKPTEPVPMRLMTFKSDQQQVGGPIEALRIKFCDSLLKP